MRSDFKTFEFILLAYLTILGVGALAALGKIIAKSGEWVTKDNFLVPRLTLWPLITGILAIVTAYQFW